MALHQEVGPSRTTIAGVAERAGVQRLTVYRHFPDEEEMIQACSALFMERHPAPDPAPWSRIEDPDVRLLSACTSIYQYFRSTAAMFRKIVRDAAEMDVVARQFARFEQWLDVSTGVLLEGRGLRGRRKEMARQTIRHALDFTTWDALERQGLGDDEKAKLAGSWLRGSTNAERRTR